MLPENAFGGYLYRLPPEIIIQSAENPLLADLILTRLGYFPNAYTHHMTRPTIDEYILFYCTGGRGWLETASGRWQIEKDHVAVVFKDAPHTYYADPAVPWTIYWAHLGGARAEEYLSLAGLSPAEPVCFVGAQNTIPGLFQQMASVLQLGYGLHQLVWASGCLGQLLGCIAYRVAYNAGHDQFDVEAIIRFMQASIGHGCDLDTLARQANMSPSHFSRSFREKTGYSPIDYFIRLKIQKACELLEISSMSVQTISAYLGYSSPYYFSRIFKKITGQSPTAYRQAM